MPGIYAFADEASSSLVGQIAAMLRNHMQGLEIRGVDGQNVSDISIEKAREVKKRLADNGLATWSVGSPIGKIDIVKDDFNAGAADPHGGGGGGLRRPAVPRE